MKNKGIAFNLYTVGHEDGSIKPNKLCSASIIGKNLFISTLEEGFENENFFNEYSFDYQYNVPFDCKIKISNNKLRKLNARITYQMIEKDQNWTQVSYTYLNLYHRLINSFHFNKLWIQQPMNIMWITNILVIILLGLANLIFK